MIRVVTATFSVNFCALIAGLNEQDTGFEPTLAQMDHPYKLQHIFEPGFFLHQNLFAPSVAKSWKNSC